MAEKGLTKKAEAQAPKAEVQEEAISSQHHTPSSPENPTTLSDKKGFFDDFQDSSKGKKYRYILFAIFALLLVGVIFLLKPQLEALLKTHPNLEQYTPVSQEPKSMHLEINNPDDELLTFDKTINISGKTSPKSSVVISNGDSNWGVETGENGEFAKVIDLKPGINSVMIYAFDPQGNKKDENRTIYYSEEKI